MIDKSIIQVTVWYHTELLSSDIITKCCIQHLSCVQFLVHSLCYARWYMISTFSLFVISVHVLSLRLLFLMSRQALQAQHGTVAFTYLQYEAWPRCSCRMTVLLRPDVSQLTEPRPRTLQPNKTHSHHVQCPPRMTVNRQCHLYSKH